MSRLGSDFSEARFVRTPISIINRLLEEISDNEQAAANINSMTTATLTNLVLQIAHGFSGSKRPGPKSKPQDYLPFPSWAPKNKKSQQLSDITKKVLSTLIRQQRIPMHVFTSLMTPPNESP